MQFPIRFALGTSSLRSSLAVLQSFGHADYAITKQVPSLPDTLSTITTGLHYYPLYGHLWDRWLTWLPSAGLCYRAEQEEYSCDRSEYQHSASSPS